MVNNGPVRSSLRGFTLLEVLLVVLLIGIVSGLVLLAAERIRKLLGTPMVSALEKLMGLVLTAIAVEMILAGLKHYFFEAQP